MLGVSKNATDNKNKRAQYDQFGHAAFEQIDSGNIKYTDKVVASANAAGMGGSQIWLEAGEEMTVEELLKGIIMASANDMVVIIDKEIIIQLL